MNPHRCREVAFAFLFQDRPMDNLDRRDLLDFIKHFSKDHHLPLPLNKQELDFALLLIQKTLIYRQQLTQKISSLLHNGLWHRLKKVDQWLLLLGSCELSHVDTYGYKAIRSFVSLARIYGSEKSYSLVNGVLDKMIKES